MKNLYVFSFALILALPAQAGNWDLFPLGHTIYYSSTAQLPTTVQTYRMDSVLPGLQGDVLYFGLRMRSEMLGPCAAVLQGPNWFPDGYSSRPDSMVQRNDTVFYDYAASTLPFFFLPQTPVGGSWTVESDYAGNSYSQITITCSSIEERTFFGITDSVKVFSLQPIGSSSGQGSIADFEIVLSKMHGLIEFVPFYQFLYHPNSSSFGLLQMIGTDDGVSSSGFHAPQFTDYFHLHTGDVYFWEYHHLPANIADPQIHEYGKDSITSSINTADSVVYHGVRSTLQQDGTLGDNSEFVKRYYRSEFELLFNGETDTWIFLPEAQAPFSNVVAKREYRLTLAGNGTDTITELQAGWYGGSWDTLNCDLYEATDVSSIYTIDTRAGYTFSEDGMQSVTTWALVGSMINGVADGDITLGISQPRPISQQSFALVPNPAKESITFQGLPPGATGQFTIYDGLGREALHGTLPTAALSVEGLQPGVYMVQVRFSDRIEMARFVKE